jgi:hypothetical protein
MKKVVNDDGKTHPNEKTRVVSDGADIFSKHQPAVENEPTNKSKTPVRRLCD